jgi:twitching motility protein PilT
MELAEICRAAVRAGASDIHIKAGQPPLVRLHGELRPMGKVPPLTAKDAGEMAWKIMSEAQRNRFKSDLELDFGWPVEGVGRFRVNVYRQRGLIGMAIRAIPEAVATIDELGLPKVVKQIAQVQRGLVLVTGATGSGKSTTLAALVEEVNRTRHAHILTIEDPIEFSFTDRQAVINQREIGSDTRSFAVALRAALRQDPDIILVGELRDAETVEVALQAAETGHLVLSTLHTIDAPDTVSRIVGFFEPHQHPQIRTLMAHNLQAVISQRLLQTQSGGRIAAVEILLNRGNVPECLADPQRIKELNDLMAKGAAQYGSQTFDQAIYRLIRGGTISVDVGLRFANNPDDLQLRLNGIGAEGWD